MSKENTLVDEVINLEDLDAATTALTELKYLNSDKAKELALRALEECLGDSHYQASAFEVLYSINRCLGLRIINKKLNDVDWIVFRSMLECVTEDSSLIGEDPELASSVVKLKEKISRFQDDERQKIGEALDWFKVTFIKKPN